jgi:transcriptional regulator with XRE-family HTH domain
MGEIVSDIISPVNILGEYLSVIGERIRTLREFKGLSRRDLEKLTGIEEYKWKSVESGKQNANEHHIAAVAALWPEYKHWLVFGETLPEAGQISPEIEETRRNLNGAG